MSYAQISELVGKTCKRVSRIRLFGNDAITFECADGAVYNLCFQQQTYEEVWIKDICGKLKWLEGAPIIKAEMNTNATPRIAENYHSKQRWTFYNLATVKGHVTIAWEGEGNGYYSLEVDFVRVR